VTIGPMNSGADMFSGTATVTATEMRHLPTYGIALSNYEIPNV